MKAVLRFLKTTLVGGVLFLLPLLLTVVLIKKGIELLDKIVSPVADAIPVTNVAGVHTRDLIAALLLVLIGFAAGLVGRTGFGRSLSERLEQLVLRKMPGYTLLKGAAGGAVAPGADEVVVVLARFDDNDVLGFAIEKPRNGLVTVFVPSAPTPAAGTVFILPVERVQRLDIAVTDATKTIMRLGVGTQELLEKCVPVPLAAPAGPAASRTT